MNATTTVPELAEAIAAAAPGLDEKGRRVAVALYQLLADGDPATAAAVAERAGVTEQEAEASMKAWPGVFHDDKGQVTGFWGLAISQMPHRFHAAGGKPVYAWCALDPFLVVPVIGRPAFVESADPVTGEPVTMTVTPGGVTDLSPATAVTSLLRPDGPFGSDVVESFCYHVFNFASPESAQQWAAGRNDIILLPVADAFEVGLRAWAKLRPPATDGPDGTAAQQTGA
jgi:hypothetical protein